MKFGLNVMGIEGLYGGDLGAVLQMVSRADAKGIDLISTCDHLGFDGAAHAERLRTHGFPYPIEQPWYEPIAFLSAVAAVTKRARLSTFVLVATLRPALLLAKQLATLDAISGGRVTIGLGVGWQKQEYEAAGMEFEGRFGRLEELVSACRVLWSQAPARFQGEHIRFENFHCRPFPVQRDKLPVLLGFAPTDRNFERIARVADGWAVNPTDLPSFGERVAALRKILAAHGRDPNKIEIEVQFAPVRGKNGGIDWDATAASAADWTKAGATTLSPVALQFCRTPADVETLIDWLLALRDRLP
ncbi:MAG TPA: TIGR03619 family F420-dependent LLM class oxidoreductase [Alphaproteobacteria bacterium]|nr:TIGR03619 family F420-dependent LLM class oxidoreductase [Alphaproteobacteria bacterium]